MYSLLSGWRFIFLTVCRAFVSFRQTVGVFDDVYNALQIDKFDFWVCKVSSEPLAGALNKQKKNIKYYLKILKTR